MNKATRTALEGSIKKWEDIEAGKCPDQGSDNCPLCSVFKRIHISGGKYKRNWISCTGCPVKRSTGEAGCISSPYDAWKRHQDLRYDAENRNASWATDKRSKELAKAELEFLISLRVE
ncbi:MAG: hypothetical protein J3T61_00080 [Candidatus Brocadiales bacterium]|nr:hypothetical protein [Candidatus Bathyanammoxibius sp.]